MVAVEPLYADRATRPACQPSAEPAHGPGAAEASNISIGLRAADGESTLTVRDDGRGFEHDKSQPGGVGMQIMRYRANMIGAQLEIRSRPGEGTEVTCSFPCAASS